MGAASSPELPQVVVPRLAVGGARDAHGEARLQLPELQQHNGQVVDEEQRVHQRHGVLHDALVVLVLPRHQKGSFVPPRDVHGIYGISTV